MKSFLMTLCVLVIYSFLGARNSDRYVMIENFESGAVTLTSYANEDINPSAWVVDSTVTYNSSLYSLQLNGNTWKRQTISPIPIIAGDVLQAAIRYSGSNARIQGIGFSNGTNTLFYSVKGTATLNIEQWVTVYQGAFSTNIWNLYHLPIADDWWAYFDEHPTITSIIYINDLDTGSGIIWFDDICKLTYEIPVPPSVSISYNVVRDIRVSNTTRNVTIDFFSAVVDPDSNTHTYKWDFGDSTYSALPNPTHTYTVTANHPYTVMLKVTDNTNRWGLARCTVNVSPGPGSLPVTLNFVGDVMLARAYEQAGGIIPTQGVNAIFQPTKHLLGAAADITSANLEVVLTNTGTPHPTKSVVYRGNPNNINGLVYAGIDIVSLANNHAVDYGLAGLQQMQDSLSAKGILYSGAGANSYEAYTPAFINKNGLNIAFLRSSDRTGQYNNTQPYLNAGYNKSGFALFTPYYLMQQINAVQGIADLKIVEMHGGSEYSLTPGSGYDKNHPFADEWEDEEYGYYTDVPHMWDLAIRRFAIDNGADVVIVHHPHIIQGLEIYNGKLIAHSLGNFVFDLTYPETMPTMILYMDADFNGFSNYRVVPCFIDRYIPRRAAGKLGTYILDYLAKRSRDLNTYLFVNKDDVTASVVVDTTQISFYPQTQTTQLRLTETATGVFTSEPLPLTRNGSISSIDNVYPGSNWEARLGSECLWMGNMEDEGANFFNPNLSNETYDTTTSHEGSRSLKIVASGTQETVSFRNRMKWYDNTKKYTLHAWIRTRAATNVNIDIQMFTSRTSYTPTSTQSLLSTALSDNNDWTFFQKEITIPSSCYFYNIICKISNGTAWFDEVGLIEWSPWQSITLLQNIAHPNDFYWLQLKGSENPKSIRLSYTEKDLSLIQPFSVSQQPEQSVLELTNYPNPFNPETRISFYLENDTKIELDIFNIKGQRVTTLVKDNLTKGRHYFDWLGTDFKGSRVASGVYFYRIKTNSATQTRKILLLK